MKFTKEDVVFVGTKEFKSKSGNDVCFLIVADPLTYENYEAMPVKGFNYRELVPGTHYTCELDCGRYVNMSLLKKQ